jgi:lipopolysaccharide export system permease protein
MPYTSSESSTFILSQGYPVTMFIFSKMSRQICLQFTNFFLSSLLIFTLIFLVSDFLSNSSEFQAVSRLETAQYYFYMLPEIIYRMIPVATLAGVIFSIAMLQRTNELIALFSLGVSLWQVASVLLILATGTSLLTIIVGDQWVPRAVQEKNYLLYNQIKKKPGFYSMVKTGRIWYKVRDTIFYIQTLNPKTNTGEGLKMFVIGPQWQILQMLEAKKIEMKKDQWILKDGVITVFSPGSQFPVMSDFDEKTIPMGEEASSLAEIAKPSEVLSMSELRRFILKNRAAGLDTLRYEVDYFGKWSFAFAGCIMSMLAIPFGVKRGRSGGVMGSIGIVLGLVFIYWTFYSSGMALGYYGRVPAFFAATFPSLVMLVFGIWGIQRIRL